MKRFLKFTAPLFAIALFSTFAQDTETDKSKQKTKKRVYEFEYQPQAESAKRLEWFKDAKFGMMICWGIYSPRGGISPDGKPQKRKYTEWYQKATHLNNEAYSKLATEFNPTKFDAEKWVLIAKNAGMKYITFTSKFHDGFAMFDSRYSTFDVMDKTPFKRDVAMELRKACDKHGIKLCFYYSHCQDWEQYHAWCTGSWIFPNRKEEIDHERYLSEKALPQVAELCIRYKADGFRFDTPWFNNGGYKLNRPVSKRFSELVRALRPEAIINSRVSHGSGPVKLHADLFDYISLGDQKILDHQLPLYTETPDSVTHSYGYDARPNKHYRSASLLLNRLIRSVANNGNYLLNVGPTGDGEIPPEAQAELKKVGAWLKKNGEAIYGTTPSGLSPEWGVVTNKGNTVYVFPLKAKDKVIKLTGLKRIILNAKLLSNGESVTISQAEDVVSITVPENDSDLPMVIVLRCEGSQL